MLKLITRHEDSLIAKSLKLKSAIDYHNESIKPLLPQANKWTANEYKLVMDKTLMMKIVLLTLVKFTLEN